MTPQRLPLLAGTALLFLGLLAGCERPPITSVQLGYRGTAMGELYNPRTLADEAPVNVVPAAMPAAPQDGPRAGQAFQNVKVLGDQSVAEFTRTMTAITSWISPKEGCAYCHNLQNFAEDALYTKVVARRMLQMTQHINSDWKGHVAATGVTCYTCHRGNAIPAKVWFSQVSPRSAFLGNKAGQNSPTPVVAYASLPNDPFTAYLLNAAEIRVAASTALPDSPSHSIVQTESTYGLMMHMSQSLGVNCTYCHNTRAFANWTQSTPQRVTAWQGIRMSRDLNQAYLVPLTGTFPARRLGPTGDVAKVNCATCHQGAFKPLYGVSMAKDYPALNVASPAASAPDAAASAAAAAPAAGASAAADGSPIAATIQASIQ